MHNNSAAYLKKTWRQHGDYKPIATLEFKFKNMATKGLPTELSPSFKKNKTKFTVFLATKWRQTTPVAMHQNKNKKILSFLATKCQRYTPSPWNKIKKKKRKMAMGHLLATIFPVANVLSLLATKYSLAFSSPGATNYSACYFSIANSIVFCSDIQTTLWIIYHKLKLI